MILSNNMKKLGKMKITTNILMIAPRAIKEHRDAIMSTLEIKPTPKVAAKNPNALTTIEGMEVYNAICTASFLVLPSKRSRL